MPKAKSTATLSNIHQALVPAGAKFIPGTQNKANPEGISLQGIRIRNNLAVEIRFMSKGVRLSETIRGLPTVALLEMVVRKRNRVQSLIDLGELTEAKYCEEFPESPRFRNKSSEPEKSILTVGMALDDWFNNKKGSVTPNTRRDYEKAINNQLKPFKISAGTVPDSSFVPLVKDASIGKTLHLPRHLGGPARPADPRDHRVLGQLPVDLFDDRVICVIREQMQVDGLGVKRINNVIAVLRQAITRLFKLKKLSVNPFDVVSPLKNASAKPVEGDDTTETTGLDQPLPPTKEDGRFLQNVGAPDPFSTDEFAAIVAALERPMANQAVFTAWTGLRTGEVIALRACDLDLERNRICVRRSASRGVLKMTKTGRHRWVDLLPPARKALENQLALFDAPDGWVFPNPVTRKRWTNGSKIERRWKRALRVAGVRYRRPYQMRHTYASMMLSAGENITYVAQQMGHADWSMLVKVYGHWLPSGAQQAAGSLVQKANAASWSKLQSLTTSLSESCDDPDFAADGDEDEADAPDMEADGLIVIPTRGTGVGQDAENAQKAP